MAERNRLYTKWLCSGKERDRKRFAKLRSDTRRATRQAKNAWFQSKAAEAQKGRHGGKVVWRCIRDIQFARRGLVPVRSAVVRNEMGTLCSTPEDNQQRWRRHFTSILNVQSQFDEDELQRVRQRPLKEHFAEPPSKEELLAAIDAMKNGKMGGKSGILPEMVKAASCQDDFMEVLLALVQQVWSENKAPQDWSDAVLIPIPKKGDLTSCDNWRGIALLDVVGKVVARLLQGRLQKLAEEELPESQCGFRKGRSCTDMIFMVRQLVEKSWEHRAKLFVTYVDLKKAYDSVPRSALWVILGKFGVPESTIQLIRSFHHGMQATIRLDGNFLDPFEVENGLRQGCCMAPVLFNLYLSAVIECWQARVRDVPGVGINLKHKFDRKLFRRYTRNAAERKILECLFADDGAILASTREGAERAICEFQSVCHQFGLTVSISKTKHMATGREATSRDRAPLPISSGEVEGVEEFPYLGSIISASGRMDREVEKRIAQAARAFGALRKAVFLDKNLSLKTERAIYQACVLSVLLYGSESWTPLSKHLKKLNSFHHRCVRIILGITNLQQRTQRISAREILRRWGDIEPVSDRVLKRRLEWLGHLARMPDQRMPKAALFGWLPQPRPRGGPRRRWRDVIKKDLKQIDVEEDEWYEEACRSRAGWRALCRDAVESRTEAQTGATCTEPQQRNVECTVCHRQFRRECDKKRHKCTEERQKPVCEQRGAIQCSVCSRWFRSKGGLAVHNCRPGA